MIVEIEDKKLINTLLNDFSIELSDNPFRKYLVFDNSAVLVYSKIYDRIEIDYLFVIPSERKKNIATKLLDYLLNLYNFSISLEVRCDNDIAIDLYKKFNFEIVAIRKNYYENIDGYLMIRK